MPKRTVDTSRTGKGVARTRDAHAVAQPGRGPRTVLDSKRALKAQGINFGETRGMQDTKAAGDA